MTDTERADEICFRFEAAQMQGLAACVTGGNWPGLHSLIASSIREAVAAEREACAKLADELEATYEVRDHEDEEAKAKGGYAVEQKLFSDAIRARLTAP